MLSSKGEKLGGGISIQSFAKVKTPPPFIVVGHSKSVDDCNNSIAECAGPQNLDAAPDMLDFIEAASGKASTLCQSRGD